MLRIIITLFIEANWPGSGNSGLASNLAGITSVGGSCRGTQREAQINDNHLFMFCTWKTAKKENCIMRRLLNL